MTHRSLPLLLLLLSTPALAQVDRPPPDPPPHAISQLNGVPVKIGERHEYIYTYRPWNVAANPLGWVVGIYGVSASYGVHPNVAVRGDLTYYNLVDSDETFLEVSAGVPLYFRRVYQGIFLEPGIVVRTPSDDSGSERLFGPQVLVGWHWSWDSGFNVAAAVGVGRDLSHEEDEFGGDGEEIFANGYLRFGYAF